MSHVRTCIFHDRTHTAYIHVPQALVLVLASSSRSSAHERNTPCTWELHTYRVHVLRAACVSRVRVCQVGCELYCIHEISRILNYTVFTRVVVAATTNFFPSSVQLLIESGSYSRACIIDFIRACIHAIQWNLSNPDTIGTQFWWPEYCGVLFSGVNY